MCDDLGTDFSSDIDTSDTGDFSDGLDTASDASFSDEIEDIPEDDFSDDMVDVSDDISEDDFEDDMVDVSDDLPEDDFEDDMVDVSNDLPEDDFEDDMVDVPDDLPEDDFEDDMVDVSDDLPEDDFEDDMVDVSDDLPEDDFEDNMVDVSDDLPEDDFEDDMVDVSDDIPEDKVADDMVDVSEDIPEDEVADDMVDDDFSDNIEDISEDDSADNFVDASDDDFLDDIEYMQDDESADNMQDVSDDIPEDEIVDDISDDDFSDDIEDISEDDSADDFVDASDDDFLDGIENMQDDESVDNMQDVLDDISKNVMVDASNNVSSDNFPNDTSLTPMNDQELGNFTDWENAYASEIDNIRNDPTLSDLEKSALLESSYNEFVELKGINNYRDADVEDGGPVKVLTNKSNQYYNDGESIDLSNDFATDTAPRSSLDSHEYTEIVNALDNMNVEYRPIAEADTNRTEQDIIDRISGGDETEGSCSSLALAYAGNKGGYDVFDYRDGNSREYFATRSSIEDIANIPGVESFVLNGTNDFESVSQLLSGAKHGEEYYLASGQHAAIIRHNNNQFEYLELQHQSDGNGWHSLNKDILKCRFGCESDRLIPSKSYMMNVNSLSKNNEFKNILGYINTAEQDQMKGTKGYVR